MNDRAASLLENYDLEVLRVLKGRGALLCEIKGGWAILKEYRGSQARLAVQEKLLKTVKRETAGSGVSVEQLYRNRDGELVSRDQDQIPYILKTYFEGRECNIKEKGECLKTVKYLALLHQAMQCEKLAEENKLPVFCLETEYEKRNRELKKVRKFLKEKGQRSVFEIYLYQNYDFFYEKALKTAEEVKGYTKVFSSEAAAECKSFCHGDFQHHNVLYGRNGMAVINFEKFILDNQVRDLYQFLRKLMEKNNWSEELGREVLQAYSRERPLSVFDFVQLYYRFAYPEKFWKIVNFYYNNRKTWIPERNMEKLSGVLEKEEAKTAFLNHIFSVETIDKLGSNVYK